MWYAGDAGEVKTNVSHNTDMLLSRSRTHLSERESARTHARERESARARERERERESLRERESERERESLFVTPQLIQIAWSLCVCVLSPVLYVLTDLHSLLDCQ